MILLGGCAKDQVALIAKDPYLPTMMKDPLYLWRPAGDLERKEVLLPQNDDQLASGSAISRIVVQFRFWSSGDLDALFQEAQGVSSSAGYVNHRRVLMPGVDVGCNIAEFADSSGVEVVLAAPF